jgi:hypothetical protein
LKQGIGLSSPQGYGKYFWAGDMIVVHRIDEETVRDSVDNLVCAGELCGAMASPFPVTSAESG